VEADPTSSRTSLKQNSGIVDLNPEKLKVFRLRTFRSEPNLRLRIRDDAIQFVNERGFVFFWPIKGVLLPSLWVATNGDRPVPDEHDDPGHITWGWKDELLGTGIWYYGRVLALRNCMISLAVLPYFYALSPNYGEPETDYLEEYRRGILTPEARNLYEVLLNEGPLDSIALRRAARLSGAGTESRFNKALGVLQNSFRLVPCGISKHGSWHYCFIYDLFHRHFPDQINQSRTISEFSARRKLILTYLNSVGACTPGDLQKLFHWDKASIYATIKSMVSVNEVFENVTIKNDKHQYLCLPELI
jgi:hypothetical protein